MSIDYSKYNVEQLLDIQQHIDKNAYPENYKALLAELNLRQDELIALNQEQELQQRARDELRVLSRSPKRVATILLAGLPISLPTALSIDSPDLSPSDERIFVMMLLLTGLPLLHSIVTGWTFSRAGIVTLKTDKFSFTVSQLFYSYLFGLILLIYVL